MRTVIYSMSVSLDGYVTGPDGDFSWSAPDAELHRFHNARVRELGAQVLGRRLYETMLYWETAAEDPEVDPVEREFAEIWTALPRTVASTTLVRAEHGTRLVRDGVEEVRRLKREGGAPIGVGGAALAASLIAHDLVDEFHLFVSPVAVGGGTPFFPAGRRVDLELLERRSFGDVTSLRYGRAVSGTAATR